MNVIILMAIGLILVNIVNLEQSKRISKLEKAVEKCEIATIEK